MSRIEIILNEPYRTTALRARRMSGEQLLDSEFKGPVFASAKYKFNAAGIEVHVGDGTVYFYPAHSFSRVKASPEEVPCAAT